MKKAIQILTIFLIVYTSKVAAQTAHFEVSSNHFTLSKANLKGTDTLTFSYEVHFHSGAGADSLFTGTVTTNINTNKDTTPLQSAISINTKTITSPLSNNDSFQMYGSFKLTSHYFDSGPVNIIVIWPTGGKTSGGKVGSIDSIHLVNKVVITTGLAGITDEKNTFNPVRIYPNPVSTFLNLEMNDPTLKLNMIRILDITGKEVYNSSINLTKIDVSQLKPGNYFLEVSSADNRKASYSFMVGK